MSIEIKTIVIDGRNLNKSIFNQLPFAPYPVGYDGSLYEGILGYVLWKESYFLTQREGQLYRTEFTRGHRMYCTKDDYNKMQRAGKDDWKDSDTLIEVSLRDFDTYSFCVELPVSYIRFSGRYLDLSFKDALPPGYEYSQLECPDPDVRESNRKILDSLPQIFLKA